MPFIIANESFEKVASYGLLPNMILYLMKDYHMTIKKGSNLLYMWSATTNLLPVVGALLADSFLGRFLTIGFGSIFSLLGTLLLFLTTVIPQAKPPPCNPLPHDCQSPTARQYTLLVCAFLLMSIGAGGVRPCSQAFGADQVDQRDNPDNRKVLERFFSWYYACGCFAVVLALTVIVYIQVHYGWRIGFGIPVILMFLSALSFFLASPFYVKNEARRSLLTSLAQVAVAAFRNRKLQLPSRVSDGQYHHKKDSDATIPSNKLRFLNKACLIVDPNQDICPDGSARNPWRLCTVEEVEELKALIRVIPIWSSGIMMSINTSQSSFPLLLTNSMDRHIGKFEVPAGSFGTLIVIVIVIWIPLYDRIILPLGSKIRGKPFRLGVKLRMGIGLFCTFLAVLVSGIVEHYRRTTAINEGFANNGQAVLHMSAMWLIPQHIFSGLAESFNAIGQTEFYYTEFPKSMSSIATCLFGVEMAVASLLASLIFNLVDAITKKTGKQSWVANNINQGRYDYYYWLLATLSLLNVVYYMFVSWAYGPLGDRMNKVSDEKDKFQVEEEMAMLRNTSRQEKGDFNLNKLDNGLSKSNELRV
ncbi:hypothetical protein Cgig2_020504 [Carnegiea gigantea]|uniref:NPF family transporter n=1 Tax=Carnegiea gigantea TaxID=171969 RepID=A0A9Q1KBT9_9CARY|nr:hypothetical protein Cgig2_020504 [Carnegiea gigantea]